MFFVLVDGNDAFPFLGDPAGYFELFSAMDSIFGAIFEPRVRLLVQVSALAQVPTSYFEQRVRVFTPF